MLMYTHSRPVREPDPVHSQQCLPVTTGSVRRGSYMPI